MRASAFALTKCVRALFAEMPRQIIAASTAVMRVPVPAKASVSADTFPARVSYRAAGRCDVVAVGSGVMLGNADGFGDGDADGDGVADGEAEAVAEAGDTDADGHPVPLVNASSASTIGKIKEATIRGLEGISTSALTSI